MAHVKGLSPEEQRKLDISIGVKGFWVLLAVTLAEVAVALFAKEFLPMTLIRLVMIGMSLFKAYYIVSIFMHLGSEVGGFASTIVLPMALLIWAVVAFLWEGDSARQNRNYVKDPRPGAEAKVNEAPEQTSMRSVEELPKAVSFQ